MVLVGIYFVLEAWVCVFSDSGLIFILCTLLERNVFV